VGLSVLRADESYDAGILLQDIIRRLIEATVVIAEISPENPNVFYELGYAHAREKPTILLAQRGRKLPFDVSGYRVIFYDDSIKGKRDVEQQLRRHLESILGRSLSANGSRSARVVAAS
jgi:nucleoside 2-deoxyribosyltransferase